MYNMLYFKLIKQDLGLTEQSGVAMMSAELQSFSLSTLLGLQTHLLLSQESWFPLYSLLHSDRDYPPTFFPSSVFLLSVPMQNSSCYLTLYR